MFPHINIVISPHFSLEKWAGLFCCVLNEVYCLFKRLGMWGEKQGQKEVLPDLRTTEICIILTHGQLPLPLSLLGQHRHIP